MRVTALRGKAIRSAVVLAVATALAATLGATAATPPATASGGNPLAPSILTPPAATVVGEGTAVSFVGPVSPLDMKTPSEIFPGGPMRQTDSSAVRAKERFLAAGDTASAELIAQISDRPTAIWLGEWYRGAVLTSRITRHVATATAQGTTPVFVTYAITNRDCGNYSAGGLTPTEYLQWNRDVADALRGSGAVVIVEPDALAMLSGDRCPGEAQRRIPLVKHAVEILGAAGLSVYLDAGNSNWVPPTEMAALLVDAGVHDARGFATNVSNFKTTADETRYADTVSQLLGGKRYVIDISRNGTEWRGTWCNPAGAAIGAAPSVASGVSALDALLWIKHPGQSDGTCNGGPPAGEWWDDYALALVRNQPHARG
ncbi:glycoside hydrolase family 6 protein [Marisediminicola sp. LYQ85]|uniref:glycoside hydrolase family 6 protein n=1 Tax=Marisediminicola sp. LYQ85 TaxID=3391062 RepID=UPI003983D2F5